MCMVFTLSSFGIPNNWYEVYCYKLIAPEKKFYWIILALVNSCFFSIVKCCWSLTSVLLSMKYIINWCNNWKNSFVMLVWYVWFLRGIASIWHVRLWALCSWSELVYCSTRDHQLWQYFSMSFPGHSLLMFVEPCTGLACTVQVAIMNSITNLLTWNLPQTSIMFFYNVGNNLLDYFIKFFYCFILWNFVGT